MAVIQASSFDRVRRSLGRTRLASGNPVHKEFLSARGSNRTPPVNTGPVPSPSGALDDCRVQQRGKGLLHGFYGTFHHCPVRRRLRRFPPSRSRRWVWPKSCACRISWRRQRRASGSGGVCKGQATLTSTGRPSDAARRCPSPNHDASCIGSTSAAGGLIDGSLHPSRTKQAPLRCSSVARSAIRESPWSMAWVGL